MMSQRAILMASLIYATSCNTHFAPKGENGSGGASPNQFNAQNGEASLTTGTSVDSSTTGTNTATTTTTTTTTTDVAVTTTATPTATPAPAYVIPSQLTCSYKAFIASSGNTVHGMMEGANRNGQFYQLRWPAKNEKKSGTAQTFFKIQIPSGATTVQKNFYLGETVPMDPTKPIMGILNYHIDAGSYGGLTIEDNILEAEQAVDIRRYFGLGLPVTISSTKSGNTGYWPIGVYDCAQNNSATWPTK